MKNVVLLRQLKDDDFESFAEMNADLEVMRFLSKPLTRAESEKYFSYLRACFVAQEWGMWALEVSGAFAGITGLMHQSFDAHFTPCVDIAWQLRREYWGRGIAYAAAVAAQAYAFERLMLSELVSFTSSQNTRSRRLAERLGFTTNSEDDFLHPLLEAGSSLCPHVLYRKTSASYKPLIKQAITKTQSATL
jgi:RimJ/RimL family protein N-acetyltransferase